MSRTIDAIIKEVSSRSDPQRQTIMNQVADIPRQIQAETAGLQAKRLQANDDILGAARDRGVGFGGIPIGEQAQYAATEFAPALAQLQTAGVDRRTSLESALSDIGRDDFANAQDIFRDERDFAENARRFQIQQEEAARARAASSNRTRAELLRELGLDAFGNPINPVPTVDPDAVARAAWERDNPQLRVSTSAPRNPQFSAGRLQGSGGSLQGGRSTQGGTVKLQGGGTNNNLRLPTTNRRRSSGGLRVT